MGEPVDAPRFASVREMRGGQSHKCGESRPLYHSFAWAYDRVVAHPAGGDVGGMPRRMRSLGVPLDALVVDAGCGSGRYAHALAQAGFRVIAVDRSAALIAQARASPSEATFVCADLLSWKPSKRAGGVLCRGVLNELIADSDRRAAFASLASWLRTGGVLVADVRDWDATVARYATQQRRDWPTGRAGRALRLSSETRLEHGGQLMRVRERYTGRVDNATVDESDDFVMRCWTADELRRHAAEAGFACVDIQNGADAGIAQDRLSLVARR